MKKSNDKLLSDKCTFQPNLKPRTHSLDDKRDLMPMINAQMDKIRHRARRLISPNLDGYADQDGLRRIESAGEVYQLPGAAEISDEIRD